MQTLYVYLVLIANIFCLLSQIFETLTFNSLTPRWPTIFSTARFEIKEHARSKTQNFQEGAINHCVVVFLENSFLVCIMWINISAHWLAVPGVYVHKPADSAWVRAVLGFSATWLCHSPRLCGHWRGKKTTGQRSINWRTNARGETMINHCFPSFLIRL